MRVLVYEDNLMWSSRLVQSLRGLGHEPVLLSKPDIVEGEVAIVNLSSPKFDPEELVPVLVAAGIRVIGHAGHKEKDLIAMGKAAGCDHVASNSELSFKLEEVLARVTANSK